MLIGFNVKFHHSLEFYYLDQKKQEFCQMNWELYSQELCVRYTQGFIWEGFFKDFVCMSEERVQATSQAIS